MSYQHEREDPVAEEGRVKGHDISMIARKQRLQFDKVLFDKFLGVLEVDGLQRVSARRPRSSWLS